MSWLDKAIGYLSPEAELRRRRARLQLSAIGAYEGAKRSRRTDGWNIKGSSVNSELQYELATLRERSRDLVRNTPYAAKAVRVLSGNMIGTGILPKIKGRGSKKAQDLWNFFAEECDFEGNTDFYGLQALMARSVVESGEVLVLKRPAPSGAGLRVPLQLQVLEPDHIDEKKNVRDTGDGGFVIAGVEFDSLGRKRAYWLFKRHPGDLAVQKSVRVPASEVIHIYEVLRPGQGRGVPWFAPVMLKMKDLDDYNEAELMAKRIQACLGVFITRAGSDTLATTTTEESKRQETLEPAMLTYLQPGEDVEHVSPPISPGYGDYNAAQLHAVAAGLGVTYELLTGDLSRVNYSSLRAGLLDFRQRNEMLRWHMWVPRLCNPVWREFSRLASVIEGGKVIPESVDWTPPRYESVDPLKDYQATVMAVRSGLMSLQTAIGEMGYEATAVLDEVKAMNDMLDERGLVLDSDPRNVTRTGVMQATQDPNQESKNDRADQSAAPADQGI